MTETPFSKEKTDQLIWGQDLKKAADAMDEPQYTPRDEPFEIVDGKRDIVPFSLLANDKKELFTIHKPVRDITLEELYTNAQKALSNITLEDYEHYKRETADLPNSFFLHIGNERSGFASYLFAIAQTTGYVALAILKNPYAKGTPITYAWKISGEFFKLCMAITDKIYADKEKRQRQALPMPQLPQLPKRHVSPNNKLINKMSDSFDVINAGGVNLQVINDRKIMSYVMVTDPTAPNNEPSRLNLFEREVLDAVCSIFKQAETEGLELIATSPVQISKAMPGGVEKPSPAKVEQIIAAVDKLWKMSMQVDATEELRFLKKIQPDETYKIDAPVIFAKKHTYLRRNNTECIGWELPAKPPILEYAEMTGQIVSVPAKVLQITETAQNGETVIISKTMGNRSELLGYLVRRVAVIKKARTESAKLKNKRKKDTRTIEEIMINEKHINPVLKYEIMFNAVGVPDTKQARKKARDFCKNYLDYWVRIKFIDGYKEKTQKRAKTGVEILFN